MIRNNMMRYFQARVSESMLFIFCCIICSAARSQDNLAAKKFGKLADSFYMAKNYDMATSNYLLMAQNSDFPAQKSLIFYNIACCLSLQEKKDSAFLFLHESVKTGYNDREHLASDADLNYLHPFPQWNVLIKSIRPVKRF